MGTMLPRVRRGRFHQHDEQDRPEHQVIGFVGKRIADDRFPVQDDENARRASHHGKDDVEKGR